MELVFGAAEDEGGGAVEEFVEKNAEGPDVGLVAVAVQDKALGGHVLRRTDVQVVEPAAW